MDRVDSRQMMADSFLRLLETRSIENVRICDITDGCHAARQTFYKHFHDKEDLIAWIYTTIANNALANLQKQTSYKDCLKLILEEFKAKQFFYTKALDMTTQNSLMEELCRHGRNFYFNVVEQNQGSAPTQEQAFSIDVIMYGVAYAVRDWILRGCKESTEEIAEYIVACLPMTIRPFLEKNPETD